MTPVLLPILTSLGLLSNAQEAEACLSGFFYDDDTVIEITVRFSFEDPTLNTPWLNAALHLSLSQAVSDYQWEPRSVSRSSDGGVAVFCVDERWLVEQPMVFAMGTRQYPLQARPVEWRRIDRETLENIASVSLASSTQSIRYGAMTTITLLPVPAPDWVVLRRFTTLRTETGGLDLVLEFFNATGVEQAEIEVGVTFVALPDMACAVGTPRPPGVPIRVSLRFVQDSVFTLTDDPSFPGAERILRPAELVPESCGGPMTIELDLGGSGPLGEGFTSLRYILDAESFVLPPRLARSVGDPSLFRWWRVDLNLIGNVQPQTDSSPL